MVDSTHDLTLGVDSVVKRYRSWDKGEPDREWAGLTLLHRTAPGLAPEPLEQRLEGGAPVIVMTRVPGEPLGTAPLGSRQLAALGHSLQRMYTAVPVDELTGLPERNWAPSELASTLRSQIAEPHPPVSPTVEAGLCAAAAWLGTTEVTVLAGPLAERVFTQADGHLSNFLWDEERCYVVDFEDSGVSDPAYEVADLVEHVSVWLRGLLEADNIVKVLAFSGEQESRLLGFRRLWAVFWLVMLLPENPGHHLNPEGSLERQAQRVLGYLS